MELFCPNCQKKLTIADTYAGQIVKCPVCTQNFQAPALPGGSTTPIVVALPAAEDGEPREPITPEPIESVPAALPMAQPMAQPDTGYGVGPASAPPPMLSAPAAAEAPAATMPPPEPAKPATVKYEHSLTLNIRRHVVLWFAPVGLVFLFVLSFFAWHSSEQPLRYLNLWELAFSAQGYLSFVFYVVLYWLAVLFVTAMMLMEFRVIPAHGSVKAFIPWAPLVVVALTGLAWILFLFHYLRCNFAEYYNPSSVAMKLAFRIHFLVVLGALLDFWLQLRHRAGKPDPRIKARW